MCRDPAFLIDIFTTMLEIYDTMSAREPTCLHDWRTAMIAVIFILKERAGIDERSIYTVCTV